MFCKICGKQLEDGTAFCDGCGTPLKTSSSEPMTVPKKKSKAPMIAAILAAVILVGGGTGYLVYDRMSQEDETSEQSEKAEKDDEDEDEEEEDEEDKDEDEEQDDNDKDEEDETSEDDQDADRDEEDDQVRDDAEDEEPDRNDRDEEEEQDAHQPWDDDEEEGYTFPREETTVQAATEIPMEMLRKELEFDYGNDTGEPTTDPVEGSSQNEGSYTPIYDTCKAYWYDMSQQADISFEGEFLIIEFVIKETTPDGNYPITISKTDIGSWELLTHKPAIIDGEVAVGSARPGSQSSASANEFTLTVNSVKGEPGDTVAVAIDIANNPGFVGFIIDVQYDSNALTIVDTRAGEDFEAMINYLD